MAISLVLMEHLLWANPEYRLQSLGFCEARFEVRDGSGRSTCSLRFRASSYGYFVRYAAFKAATSRIFDALQNAANLSTLLCGASGPLCGLLHPRSFKSGTIMFEFALIFYLQNTPLWWSASMPAVTIAMTNHLWSLAVEEQFYLVWPVLIYFCSRSTQVARGLLFYWLRSHRSREPFSCRTAHPSGQLIR